MSMIEVQDLIKNYKPLYPDGENWEGTIKHLLSSPTDNLIITDLLEALEKHGAFRGYIYVGTAVREDDSEFQAVLNGTHRVAAAIIFNLNTLEVKTEEEYDAEEEADSFSAIHLELTFKEEPDLEKDEEHFDIIFNYLRSFKINEEEWVTADICTSSREHVSLYYEGSEGSPESFAQINNKIIHLLKDNPELANRYISHQIEILDDESDENNDN